LWLSSFILVFSAGGPSIGKSQLQSPTVSFEKQQIRLGKKTILVEVADTPEKSARGLMYRKNIGSNEGMLFVFPSEQLLSFWMKNTFVDLSIGYFSGRRILIEIKNMKAAKSEMQTHFETYESSQPAQYALEMRLGWFEKNNIKVGDKLELFIKK
jgi:uncharacterized membrane protein (UPF0127 family)